MMFEGIFELFPDFRFGCIECGVGWVPYMMDRMDEEQERKGHYSPRCKLKPSEYIKKGNIFFAVEVEESALPLTAQVANENALIWASDYPHERDQRDFSHDIPNLINRKDVSDELKRKIFWDNPLRFYPRLRDASKRGKRPCAQWPGNTRMASDEFIAELWGYAREVPMGEHPWFQGILQHRWTREQIILGEVQHYLRIRTNPIFFGYMAINAVADKNYELMQTILENFMEELGGTTNPCRYHAAISRRGRHLPRGGRPR